jgi:ribonuclease VapC
LIVVDSSALCAVFFNEPEKNAFQAILDGDERCIVSAVNAHETGCVLRVKFGQAAVVEFWQWLTDNGIEIVAFDAVQAYEAIAAFDRYGKGLHPRARLSLADCAAYALARIMNAPLLFKGDDFAAPMCGRRSKGVGAQRGAVRWFNTASKLNSNSTHLPGYWRASRWLSPAAAVARELNRPLDYPRTENIRRVVG